MLGRLVRLIWGGDLNPALRPVIAVSLVGSIAGSTMFPFLGIWAIKRSPRVVERARVRVSERRGPLGVVGYLGGHTSDRIGRRPMILIGEGCIALVPLGCCWSGTTCSPGLILLALLPVFGSLGGAADQAMVADLVPPEEHEAAYSAVRVAANLGVTIGPPLGGLLLIGGHWRHLWIGVLPLRRSPT